MIDVASAQVSYPSKGEDTFIARRIGDAWLLAVADGLTMDNGRAAAQWAVEFLASTCATNSIRTIFDEMLVHLRSDVRSHPRSETTLSCGILTHADAPDTLRFSFFAIGDSPIWKIVRTHDARYPYQRYLVHGAPYPSETARLYSTLRLKERDISGAVSFGSVDIEPGAVLVVCSDGIPEREIMVRDLAAETAAIRLCDWLVGPQAFSDEGLEEVILGYERRGLLSDDATLIAARTLSVAVSSEVMHEIAPEASESAEFEPGLDAAYDETPAAGAPAGGPHDRSARIPALERAHPIGLSPLRKRPSLHDRGIPNGALLKSRDGQHTAEVVGANKVSLDGRQMTLRKATAQLLGRPETTAAEADNYWELEGGPLPG
jgi:hypothetical protein